MLYFSTITLYQWATGLDGAANQFAGEKHEREARSLQLKEANGRLVARRGIVTVKLAPQTIDITMLHLFFEFPVGRFAWRNF